MLSEVSNGNTSILKYMTLFIFKHLFIAHSVFVACVAFFVLGHDFAGTVDKSKKTGKSGQHYKNDVILLNYLPKLNQFIYKEDILFSYTDSFSFNVVF